MNTQKAEKRDVKRNKRKYGHREDGRSAKFLWNLTTDKAQEARK